MRSKYKPLILFLAIILIVYGCSVNNSSIYPKKPFVYSRSWPKRVCFKKNCFSIELALTPEERACGLMFREYLNKDEGMLFVYEEERKYSFWMKNTVIPLDMIWINNDKEVVFIAKNVQPCRQDSCPVIYPDRKALYVLELNAGLSDDINLKVGDKMHFE